MLVLKACTYPYPLTFGHLNKNPRNETVVPNKGPPTIIDAKLIADPTETPTLLFGKGISRDSTTIARTVQNISILKSTIAKL